LWGSLRAKRDQRIQVHASVAVVLGMECLWNTLCVEAATHEEVLEFMDTYRLMGKGLGYVDVHLLASAALSRVAIWSLDKRLKETATILGLAFMG